MRILHLTTEFPPVIYGGLGTAVGGWVTASARAGVSVAVQLVEGPLVLSTSTSSAYYGYGCGGNRREGRRSTPEAHVADGSAVPFFQSYWSNAIEVGIRAVRTWRPDVVHLHTAMLWYV